MGIRRLIQKVRTYISNERRAHWQTEKIMAEHRLAFGKSRNVDADLALYSKANRKLSRIENGAKKK